MEPKIPQLSAYDVLGYLVPGLAFAVVVDLSMAHHAQHLVLTLPIPSKSLKKIKS